MGEKEAGEHRDQPTTAATASHVSGSDTGLDDGGERDPVSPDPEGDVANRSNLFGQSGGDQHGDSPIDTIWTSDDEQIALVGAGPGDPGLLTVRAWRLLQTADVVLYDSLTNQAIIDSLSQSECIDVGKRSEPRTTQREIHDLMQERAAGGDRVVRLKGGDPVVFGRGGEEAEFLAETGIPFQIVPGVSSVIAAPELAGIPLTHREISSSFTVITGHEAAKKDESYLGWDALADRVDAGETLVVLMGVKRLPDYVTRLLDRGVSPDVPVAMIEKVTWEDQQTVTGRLDTIVDAADSAEITPPATTVIGGVVEMRDRVGSHNLETCITR